MAMHVQCKALKTILFDKELTYKDLSEEIGISENTLFLKINGKRKWWLDESIIAANYLGFNCVQEVFPEFFQRGV